MTTNKSFNFFVVRAGPSKVVGLHHLRPHPRRRRRHPRQPRARHAPPPRASETAKMLLSASHRQPLRSALRGAELGGGLQGRTPFLTRACISRVRRRSRSGRASSTTRTRCRPRARQPTTPRRPPAQPPTPAPAAQASAARGAGAGACAEAGCVGRCTGTRGSRSRRPPPPSRTKWTRLVHPSVLTGHVSSL